MERGTTWSERSLVGAGMSRATFPRIGEWPKIVRFESWARFLVLPAAGVEIGAPMPAAIALARGVGIAAALLAFGYLANSLGDRAMDRDPAKNALVAARCDDATLKRALAVLAIVALACCATAPKIARVATIVCLASGWAYSLGPRCKRFAIVGTLMNVLNFTPLLVVGVADAAPPRLAWIAAAFAALLVQNQLLHEAADAPEDRVGALRTTFLALGARAAARLAALSGVALAAVACALAMRSGWPAAIAACALALPFVVVFPWLLARRGGSPEAMARVRVAQRWTAMIAVASLAVLAS